MEPVQVVTPEGRKVGEVVLDDSIFGVEPNIGVMHQVVTAQLAARRAGAHSTKSRAEVAGGGSKPWRQKGTGRARHGSIRAPQWRGGGAAHGPKPRDYSQRTPKKMKRLALASALSDRARSGSVIVVDRWRFDGPRTRDGVAALDAIGATGKVLVVLGDDDSDARKSFRNLPPVHCLHHRELNTYDVLDSDVVVFTVDTVPGDHSTVDDPSPGGAEGGGAEDPGVAVVDGVEAGGAEDSGVAVVDGVEAGGAEDSGVAVVDGVEAGGAEDSGVAVVDGVEAGGAEDSGVAVVDGVEAGGAEDSGVAVVDGVEAGGAEDSGVAVVDGVEAGGAEDSGVAVVDGVEAGGAEDSGVAVVDGVEAGGAEDSGVAVVDGVEAGGGSDA